MNVFRRLINPILPWALQRPTDDREPASDLVDLTVKDGDVYRSESDLYKKVASEIDGESARELIEFQRRIAEKSN